MNDKSVCPFCGSDLNKLQSTLLQAKKLLEDHYTSIAHCMDTEQINLIENFLSDCDEILDLPISDKLRWNPLEAKRLLREALELIPQQSLHNQVTCSEIRDFLQE